jgi:hypothetical protein
MAGYSVKFIRWGGYSFDEATIHGLADEAAKFAEMAVDTEISLEDGHTITGSNVSELIGDSFLKSFAIKQVMIRAFNYAKPDSRRSIMIILRDRLLFEGVLVDMTADRQSCTVTRTELENIIDGKRQWYAKMFISSGWALLLALGWCGCAAAIGATIMSSYFPGQWSFAALGSLAGLVIGIGSISIMHRMFPKVTFEIGISSRKGESARVWRVTVGSVLILGIIVAVIGGLIVEHIR